jgi:hypothetical protein
MKNNDKHDQITEVHARAAELSFIGSTVEKAVKYLNAEFNLCFYAVRKTLWVSYIDGSQEQRRAIGAFA